MIVGKTLSYLLWIVVRTWSRTLRVVNVNSTFPAGLASEGRNVVYAFWHDSMFLLPAARQNSGIVVMVSESKDGDIAAGMLIHFGFTVIRGSTRRKGHRALIALADGMRQGRSVAIAVDGPRGPRHRAKEGAVFLAGKMKAPVLPVATAVKRGWTLDRSWDRFIIPVPFTRGVVHFGDPITVNGTSREEIEEKQRELTFALCKLTQDAEALAAVPAGGR